MPLEPKLNVTLESIGDCKIRIGERSNAGAQARFEAPDAAFVEKIEDKLWSIHDENTESRHPRDGSRHRADQIFEQAVASGAISIDDCSILIMSK